MSILNQENLKTLLINTIKKIDTGIITNGYIDNVIKESLRKNLININSQIQNNKTLPNEKINNINILLLEKTLPIIKNINRHTSDIDKNVLYIEADKVFTDISKILTDDSKIKNNVPEITSSKNDTKNILNQIKKFESEIENIHKFQKNYITTNEANQRRILDEKFNDFVEHQQKTFDHIIEDARTKLGEIIIKSDNHKEEIATIKATAQSEYEKIKRELNKIKEDSKKKHNEILQLYHLSSGATLSTDYSKTAEMESGTAMFWRVISVIALSVVIFWLYNLYIEYSEVATESVPTQLNLLKVGFQISLTFIFLYVSIYASQLSTRHWNEHVKNRSMALQMTTLEPFIEPLNDDDKSEMRKTAGERFFTGAMPYSTCSEDKQLIQTITDAVPKVVDGLKSVCKKS